MLRWDLGEWVIESKSWAAWWGSSSSLKSITARIRVNHWQSTQRDQHERRSKRRREEKQEEEGGGGRKRDIRCSLVAASPCRSGWLCAALFLKGPYGMALRHRSSGHDVGWQQQRAGEDLVGPSGKGSEWSSECGRSESPRHHECPPQGGYRHHRDGWQMDKRKQTRGRGGETLVYSS